MAGDSLIWSEARAALPLPALMRQLGDGDAVPKKFGGEVATPCCPFCKEGKGKWIVKQREDGTFSFHCFRTSCEANAPAAGDGEIGYLALRRMLSNREAAREFLDLALPDRKKDRETGGRGDKAKDAQPHPAMRLEGGPWHELWKKLPLTGPDLEAITRKRGLSRETLELCGVRSNNAGNKELILGLRDRFPEVELVDLGILKDQEGRITAAGQLTGWGRTGEFHCRPCDTTYRGRRCPKCNRKPKPEEAVWSPDVEPPIIPYFGTDGTVLYLRPHKGGIRNRELKLLQALDIPDEEDEDHECASHVYVPPNFEELLAASDGTAVFTEGEWKVQALMQCEIPALGCPGITFIRNPVFREELIGLLRHYGVRNLVIIFDNEDKGNPELPGYQPDPRKQHDAQLMAEYTQLDLFNVLRARGGSVRVGRLPDDQRDAQGKADFDGILGRLVEQHGMVQGTKAARRIFRKCMERSSESPATDRELFPFPGSVRRILDRRLYLLQNTKEKLSSGGYTERELAKMFRQWDRDGIFSHEPLIEGEKPKPHHVDKMMADAFDEVDGCYYVRKDVFGKDKAARQHVVKTLLPEVQGKIVAARMAKEYDKLKLLYAYQRSLRERLKGKPVPISACTIKGQFRLRTPGGDTVRLVHIYDHRDRKKQSPLYHLSKEDSASPQALREWLIGIGRGSWGGSSGAGQDAVDKLNIMLDDDVYLCDIHSITHCGWHEPTNIWFFGDGAFIDDRSNKEGMSAVVRPDETGVFWNPIDGVGYKLDAKSDGDDGGKSTFALGLPKLFGPQRGDDDTENEESLFDDGHIGDAIDTFIAKHFSAPQTKPVRDLLQQMRAGDAKPSIENLLAAASVEKIPLPDFTRPDPVTGLPMTGSLSPRAALETELARAIFGQMRDDLIKTVGDRDAWLAMGTMCAYAFGPELVQNYLCHPGIFFTGGYQTGKTETARRMTRIFGMGNKFIDLSDTSQVAIIRTLAQYSSLPPPFDEYRLSHASDPRQKFIDGILRAATQRGESHKGTIASQTSTVSTPPRTSPVVTGENSPRDSATASRYVHLTMSSARRKPGSGEAWDRVKAWAPHYYHLGRWLMMRRASFARLALTKIRTWMTAPDVKAAFGDQERIKLDYGVAHCTFNAVAEMLGLALPADEAAEFQSYAITYGARSMVHVKDETFRNRFWSEIITALGRNTGIRPKFFGQKLITLATPEGTPVRQDMPMNTEIIRSSVRNLKNPMQIKVTNHIKHAHPVPVVFIAAKQLYEEWLRDLASRHEACPIGFANLRGEIEKEDYFIPRPAYLVAKDGEEDHRQRFKLDDQSEMQSRPWACWCISLGRRKNEDGTDGDYVFPFARRLIDALSESVSDAIAEKEDSEV